MSKECLYNRSSSYAKFYSRSHHARYTEEYKKEALELWRASGRSAAKVAAELGIRAPLLYRWARPKRQANLSGNESKSGRSVEELEAEIRRLRTGERQALGAT